jgi:hypothetical protein
MHISYNDSALTSYQAQYDADSDLNDAIEAASIAAAEEIRSVFLREVHAVNPAHLTLPLVTGNGKVSRIDLQEAVGDMLGYEAPMASLLRVLKFSMCPEVEALRKAMAEQYVEMQAGEIGQARAGGGAL